MKNFLQVFFITLGIIFFILILVGMYFFVTDPLNIKPIFFGQASEVTVIETIEGSEQKIDNHPLLSEAQEKTLETLGIDPGIIPTDITPAQESCFVDILGSARVAEIKVGSSPTAAEYFQARNCV
jgi:hypothetical protein